MTSGELSACSIDVGATIATHCCVDTEVDQLVGKFANFLGCAAFGEIARRRIKRDQIDVRAWFEALAKFGEFTCVAWRVVDIFDQRPLERDPTIFLLQIFSARLHQIFDRVTLVDRHERVAQIVARGVK